MLKLYHIHDCVSLGDFLDQEESWSCLAWATTDTEALALGAAVYPGNRKDLGSAEDPLQVYEECFMDAFKTYAPEVPGIENRRIVQRLAGFCAGEDDDRCDNCELYAMMIPAFKVCLECYQCLECGHTDDCPALLPAEPEN